jgi:hypothetical protein
MKAVYLAAAFWRKEEMKALSLLIKELGVQVTSRWLDEESLPKGETAKARFLRDTAQMDADDVKAADTLIRFSDDLSMPTIPSSWGTGSRLEECGMAHAWSKQIVIVGGTQSLFDRFPQRIHVRDAEDLLKYLKHEVKLTKERDAYAARKARDPEKLKQKNHERDERKLGRIIQPREEYLSNIRKSPEHLAKVAKKAQQRYRYGNDEKAQAYRNLVNSRHTGLKAEVLSHYGPEGKLGCCWSRCGVRDIDILTLDHVNNDGAAHRKKVKGMTSYRLYGWIKAQGFPEGFQTLCWNHQWKKEIARTRTEGK